MLVGEPITTPEVWAELTAPLPQGPPQSVAIESHFSDGVSVARAWRSGAAAVVCVADCQDLTEAASLVQASGYRGTVLVGASLVSDPALKPLRVASATITTRNAALDLGRLMGDGSLVHDGGEHLTNQVLAMRTTPGTDGPRLRSTGRADAVKACVWAASAARRPGPGKARILLPTSS